MYTVKAFKKFELITEDYADCQAAVNRFDQIVATSGTNGFDAAYVYDAHGRLAQAWSEDYTNIDNGVAYDMAWSRPFNLYRGSGLYSVEQRTEPDREKPWNGLWTTVNLRELNTYPEQCQLWSISSPDHHVGLFNVDQNALLGFLCRLEEVAEAQLLVALAVDVDDRALRTRMLLDAEEKLEAVTRLDLYKQTMERE